MKPLALRLTEVCGQPPDANSARAECAILRAAIHLFGRHGYAGTSVRAIAERAGVTAPLIGYHFGNKEGLFRTAVELVFDGMVHWIPAELEGTEGLEDFVRRYAQVQIEFAERHPDAIRFALSIVYGPEQAQPEVDIVTCWADLNALVHDRITSAIDAGEFVPRPGATVQDIVRHLFNIVHLEVFAIYERERFAGQLEVHDDLNARPTDPVEDIVLQFFHGAGTLRPSSSTEEDASR